MTSEDIKKASVTIKHVPVVLWRRFKGACAERGITMPQGLIEAINLFLNKDD